MKTLKNLLVAIVTLFTLSSYSQTTYTYYVDNTPFGFTGTQNVQVGDVVEFVNSYASGTQFIAKRDGVGLVGYNPTNTTNMGAVIYSYTILSSDVNFDIQVGVASAFTAYFQRIYFTVSATTGVDEVSNTNFTVYPNPTTDFLNLKGDNIESVKVFDMSGKLVLSDTYNTSNVKLDVTSLVNGYYTVLVNDVKPIKFIKN